MLFPARLFVFAVLGASMVSFGASERVRAQAALLGPGAAYLGAGVAGINTENLDDRLRDHGYPTFGQRATIIGVGAYRTLQSGVMLGGEFNGLMIGEKPYANGDIGLGGGYATLGVGYMIKLSPRARVYPRLGLGAGGFGLWFDNEADSVRFDEVLDDPQPSVDIREPVLGRDGLVADVGGGVEVLRGRRGRGAMIGLRLGYLVAPFDSRWHYYERKVSGAPDSNISGVYIRMILGGAWKR
jgi:hypothetical protein